MCCNANGLVAEVTVSIFGTGSATVICHGSHTDVLVERFSHEGDNPEEVCRACELNEPFDYFVVSELREGRDERGLLVKQIEECFPHSYEIQPTDAELAKLAVGLIQLRDNLIPEGK